MVFSLLLVQKSLGGGLQLIVVGGGGSTKEGKRLMVQSVPGELNVDHTALLQLAEVEIVRLCRASSCPARFFLMWVQLFDRIPDTSHQEWSVRNCDGTHIASSALWCVLFDNAFVFVAPLTSDSCAFSGCIDAE